MRKLPLLALCVALAACSKGSDDEDGAGYHPPTAQTKADFVAGLDKRFAHMDRNNDGAIQLDELHGRRGSRVKSYDTNGDGEITRSEFQQGSIARFDREDANHDGTVTSDERRAAWQADGGGNDQSPE